MFGPTEEPSDYIVQMAAHREAMNRTQRIVCAMLYVPHIKLGGTSVEDLTRALMEVFMATMPSAPDIEFEAQTEDHQTDDLVADVAENGGKGWGKPVDGGGEGLTGRLTD